MLQNINSQPSADFTVRQTAKILQVSIHKVYELIHDGKLKSYKVSERGIRVSEAQLEQFKNSGGVK